MILKIARAANRLRDVAGTDRFRLVSPATSTRHAKFSISSPLSLSLFVLSSLLVSRDWEGFHYFCSVRLVLLFRSFFFLLQKWRDEFFSTRNRTQRTCLSVDPVHSIFSTYTLSTFVCVCVCVNVCVCVTIDLLLHTIIFSFFLHAYS